MDHRTRKLITSHEDLHPRDELDWLYESRKEGIRGLASIEHSVGASIRKIEDYIKKSKERLITAASNSTDNIMTNRTTAKTKKEIRKKKSYWIFQAKTIERPGPDYEKETFREKLDLFLLQRHKNELSIIRNRIASVNCVDIKTGGLIIY